MVGSKAAFAARLLEWYGRSRRDLPWRAALDGGRPDPYLVLVSEAMLQQTQVATALPYFQRFVARFGSFVELAEADEQEVLRLWQGLGYYARARNLLAAARKVVGEWGGALPRDVKGLMQLPGVGRYTAGAVASIAFDARAPILDGNVVRVLCRLDAIAEDSREKGTQLRLWERAEAILPDERAGDFNSALMELGALVCIPRSPRCLLCPVRSHCEAAEAGMQEAIPAPRKSKETPLLRRRIFCIRRGVEWLIEQRPTRGRWAGLWQFITIEASGRRRGAPHVSPLPVAVESVRRIGEVTHALTHRRYHFDVFQCVSADSRPLASDRPRAWVTIQGLDRYPLPRPHQKAAELLRSP